MPACTASAECLAGWREVPSANSRRVGSLFSQIGVPVKAYCIPLRTVIHKAAERRAYCLYKSTALVGLSNPRKPVSLLPKLLKPARRVETAQSGAKAIICARRRPSGLAKCIATLRPSSVLASVAIRNQSSPPVASLAKRAASR